ncbi:MAG: hypothetical protein ACLUKN_16830 [Bacilli bacterium]
MAATVAERLRADPKTTVYVDLKLVGAEGVDKLVVRRGSQGCRQGCKV